MFARIAKVPTFQLRHAVRAPVGQLASLAIELALAAITRHLGSLIIELVLIA
jgi:hypothetical protein